jgi:hypothetical protein
MDEQLLGYLLGALEPRERIEVEAAMLTRPEMNEQLDSLRQVLEPLAADQETAEPPRDLWVRTLARVAEYKCRKYPVAPLSAAARAPMPVRTWWHRADVLVAASIALCLLLLIPPGLAQVRFRATIVSCQDNLRAFYSSLRNYAEQHHGEFPNVAVAAPRPRNVAGIFVPLLKEHQLLPDNLNVNCPANGHRSPSQFTVSELQTMAIEEFMRQAPNLGGCYAYSLGYDDGTGVRGLQIVRDSPVNAYLPIMADRPPFDVALGDLGNSPNHGGMGQNVLYIDGHCAFRTTRTVGYRGDDIFVNFDQAVHAGKSPWDSVLGSSSCRP